MWKILQQKKPKDYVIATGKQYTIKQFVNFTARELDIRIKWKGKGVKEKGYDENDKVIVECDPKYLRPLDVNTLLGNAKKARKELKWKPKFDIKKLVKEMVEFEVSNLEK
jgi:GDPmannose 4,6-dehydratase